MEKLGSWIDEPCFYCSVQDAGRTGLILGPFRTEKECREYAYRESEDGGNIHKNYLLHQAAEKADSKSVFYAFGMVKMKNGYTWGVLNNLIEDTSIQENIRTEGERLRTKCSALA